MPVPGTGICTGTWYRIIPVSCCEILYRSLLKLSGLLSDFRPFPNLVCECQNSRIAIKGRLIPETLAERTKPFALEHGLHACVNEEVGVSWLHASAIFRSKISQLLLQTTHTLGMVGGQLREVLCVFFMVFACPWVGVATLAPVRLRVSHYRIVHG